MQSAAWIALRASGARAEALLRPSSFPAASPCNNRLASGLTGFPSPGPERRGGKLAEVVLCKSYPNSKQKIHVSVLNHRIQDREIFGSPTCPVQSWRSGVCCLHSSGIKRRLRLGRGSEDIRTGSSWRNRQPVFLLKKHTYSLAPTIRPPTACGYLPQNTRG